MPHTPVSTDIVASVDTTGIAPGPHGEQNGVTVVYDLDREAQGYDEAKELSIGERYAEKGKAGGTEEYQKETADASWVDNGNETPPMTGGSPVVESSDTTGTDTGSSSTSESPNEDKGEFTTEGSAAYDNPDGAGTQPGPEGAAKAQDEASGDVYGASESESESDDVYGASEPESEADYNVEEERPKLEALTLVKLVRLSKSKDLDVDGNKVDYVDALVEAKVSAADAN